MTTLLEVAYGDRVTYLRHWYTSVDDEWLCGTEVDEHGIAARDEGCSEGAELRIKWGRVSETSFVEAKSVS